MTHPMKFAEDYLDFDRDEAEAEYLSALPSDEELAPTRIIAVVNVPPSAMAETWGHPNAQMFEVAEGPHAGKRGPDIALFDLVGPILWDKDYVSDYSTGVITGAVWE